MKFFAAHGRFWIPERSQRVIHGSLTFDEDGVRLDLTAPLQAPKPKRRGSPEWADEAVVHGRLRNGTEVTLLGLRGWSMPLDGMDETWSADFALTGGLASDETFSRVTVIFDYLMPWVQPPGITRGEPFSSSITVETQQMKLAETALADGRTVRLVTGVEGRQSGDSVHLDQWCGLEVTGHEPKQILEVLNKWIRPLQDLLVVCIGQPVRIEQVLIGNPERVSGKVPLESLFEQILAGPQGHNSQSAQLDLLFKAVQPTVNAHVAAAHLSSHESAALLNYATSPLPFSTLVREWFNLCDRLPDDVVTQLCGPYYAPFIYSRHRYASTFQSAEALAKELLETREEGPREHRARVEAVTAVLEQAQLDQRLDEKDADWAISVLRGVNYKKLSQLMEELIAQVGDMGQELLAAVPDLPVLLARARTGVSHGGAMKGPNALGRYWLGEALIWVLRVRLLAELGVPVSDLSAYVIQKTAFQEALHELVRLRPGADKPKNQ